MDPLPNLLRKGQPTKIVWTSECQKSFEILKDALCSQPILTIFDPNLPIYIYTDASLLGVGGVMKQPQKTNGEEKPVAYFSKKLNEVQKRKKAIYL